MCEKDHPKHINNKVKNHYKKKFGASLEQAEAHKEAHKAWDRRTFLKMTGLSAMGGAMMLGASPVQAFAPNSFLQSLTSGDCGDRILVLIRLNGGNDGLNTVILRDNDEYYNIRPTLAVPESGLWALNDDYGMPNEMIDLEPMWQEGKMKVIHNVGYPNQNYSHFRSSDIWASASASNELIQTGWMGRWLDKDFPAFLSAPPVIPPALQIGIQTNMVFRADYGNMALAISNPTEFYQIAQTGELYQTGTLGNIPNEKELTFVRSVANSAFRYSESIQGAYNMGNNQVAYPNNYLAEQLAIVSRLIKGNLGTKVFMVSIGGFDTHANQASFHPILINYLASSVKAFFDDLAASGHSQNVLAMTFSEFGRTIYENGSVGTDHGTGAPLFLFGDDIGQGFHGTPPDLVNVNPYGDPEHDVDFRSVYASVLGNWLCAPDAVTDHILGEDLGIIDGLLPDSDPPQGSNEVALLLGHNPANDQGGTAFEIKYALKRRGNVRLTIRTKSGQLLRTLVNEFKEKGSYTFVFHPDQYFLTPGEYLYQLEGGGRSYTRVIRW